MDQHYAHAGTLGAFDAAVGMGEGASMASRRRPLG